MAVFKFVISSKDGKAYQVEKDQNDCMAIIGKKIGDTFSGDLIGLSGYELEIKGGSDQDGFPMRNDVEGVVRKRFIISKGVGFSGQKRYKKGLKEIKGLRRKKSIRGNTIGEDITQINCVVSKKGEKDLETLLGGGSKEEESKESEGEKKEKKESEDKPKESKKEDSDEDDKKENKG